MTVLERLKTGDFNVMQSEDQPDGSEIITLVKRGDDHTYKMRVRDLYGENEELLWEEVKEI